MTEDAGESGRQLPAWLGSQLNPPSHNTLDITRLEGDPISDIEDMLEGRVFHVTRRSYWPLILASGAILPNTEGKLPTTFGSSSSSFFRLRGCVSLFDWRQKPPDDAPDQRYLCWPFQPPGIWQEGVAIAVFSTAIESRLLAWNDGRDDSNYAQMIVPYVEVGHQGPIGLELVDHVIFLRLEEDPNSTSLGALIRASTIEDGTG